MNESRMLRLHRRQGRFAALVLFVGLMSAGFALADDDKKTPDGAVPVPHSGEEGAVKVEEAEASVTGALQGKEGVRIQTMCTHCNSANIQVGGLNQDLVPLERDGFPLFGGLMTSFVLSVLPADSVAEAQVTKGPGEVREPATAAGGLIELTPSRPDEMPRVDIAAGAGSYGLSQQSLRAAGQLTSWLSASATLGVAKADAVDDDADGWHDVPELDREYFEGELRLTPSKRHEINVGGSWIAEDSLEGRGKFDIISYLFTNPSEPQNAWTQEDTFVDRREFRVGWRWRLRQGGTVALRLLDGTRHQSVYSQDTAVDVPGFSMDLQERLKINQRQTWGALTLDQPIGLSWRLSAGVEKVHDEATATVRELGGLGGPGATAEEATEEVETLGGYADLRWTISSRWDVQVGLRHDDDEFFGDETSPRATVRYYPAQGWTLRAIAGKSFRVPKPIFSEVCCGQKLQRNVLEDGTILVRPEVAMTTGLEGTYQPSPTFKLNAYLAQTDFDDYIVRVAADGFGNVWTYANVNVPEARSQTAELSASWTPFPRFTVDASIGWLEFENQDSSRQPVARISFGDGFREVPVPMERILYRPDQTGSLSLSYVFPREISVSASANYTGPMLIQQLNDLQDALMSGDYLLEEPRETEGFWLVGLSADLPLSRWLSLSLGVDNIGDEIQADLGDPSTDYNWGPLAGRSWRAGLRVRLGDKP